jgi:signal transduction histidine kinase
VTAPEHSRDRRHDRWHDRWPPRWHRRWRHSIKARLVALFLLLALCTSAVFLFGLQRALQGGWQGYVRPLAGDYIDRLVVEIGSPPDAERAAQLVARLPVTLRIEGPSMRYDSHPGQPRPRRFDRGDRADRGDFEAADWGLVRHTADGHRITFGLATAPRGTSARGIGWITLGVLLALTTIAYLGVRRLLAPLADITRGVQAFGEGRFGVPIAVRRRDELGDLATRVNAMATSLHERLEAKRLLLLAISHELRSPLTRARLNAELLADSAERSALLHDLAEMRELITSLLESERLAEGHAALHREDTALAAWVRAVVAEEFEGQAVGLELDASLPDQAVDTVRLRLALRNLLANALKHGAAATPPTVFLRIEASDAHEGDAKPCVALGVRDHGPGVPPEQLARLGEAFYRPDDARSRAHGGVGLGLHLCRLVGEAHGGRLRLLDAKPGLEATLLWPAGRSA